MGLTGTGSYASQRHCREKLNLIRLSLNRLCALGGDKNNEIGPQSAKLSIINHHTKLYQSTYQNTQ